MNAEIAMPQRPSIQQPSGYVTLNAVAFADTQGNATSVAVASPLPVASVTPRDGAALSTPLTGSVSDVTAHLLGPFAPQIARDIWATLVGTGASGTARLLRSTDGGGTTVGLTAGGDAWASWTFSGVTGPIVNEQVATETSASATYYLAVALTAGSITYRIEQ